MIISDATFKAHARHVAGRIQIEGDGDAVQDLGKWHAESYGQQQARKVITAGRELATKSNGKVRP